MIHGLDDTLIDPSGGKRTAELIPGARLLLIPTWATTVPGNYGVTCATPSKRTPGSPAAKDEALKIEKNYCATYYLHVNVMA